MNWANALAIAEKGFEAWAAKDHNRKWVRKIDGTPIKNDLLVDIATAFAEAHVQPAPIAGLEPVAWQLRYSDSNDPWVIAEKVNTTSLIEWRGLVPVEQAQAHAAEQVRAEREVCASIIDARCAEVLSRQYSDDPPPTEFEQSVNTNLRLTAALLPDLSAAIRARGQS